MARRRAMVLASCSVLLGAAAGGCSLVYDADDLRAGRDGGMAADADPDALFVSRVAPDAVFEGAGSAFDAAQAEMVRAIPIVLEGQNMTPETVFTIEGLGLDGAIEDVVVSGDGHLAAFALRVPILAGLADGDQGEHLAIHLAKGDEEASAPLVTVTGLDSLEQSGGTLDSDQLHPMYSHVVLSGELAATGSAPIRILATAGIALDGMLRADAGNAPDPGPGGCRGGASASAAGCGAGSGKAGESSASPGGGGGGGYGTGGTAGTGGDGQAGGSAGQKFVVPLPPAEGATAHGAGGGGGGDNVATAGGRGGGSGGVVELTTPAVLTMTAAASLSVAGGDGQSLACATGGGGGGGSGGAILLRAGALLADGGANASALGGQGAGEAGCRGGDGGKGRIRIDRGNDAGLDSDPAAFIGATPVVTGLPVIVTEAALALPVRGAASESYQIFAGDGDTPVVFDTGADGTARPEVTLAPGLNHLCVQAAAGAELDYPEALNCVDVAYIQP